jgi:excisionase family DNA binding protein
MATRVVSIAEAARLTGLPKDAIRSRVERGELRAVRRAGVRRISVDELAERGLLEPTSGDILDRLERQAGEIGRLRLELAIAHRKLDSERRARERIERRERRR